MTSHSITHALDRRRSRMDLFGTNLLFGYRYFHTAKGVTLEIVILKEEGPKHKF
jgi:hypothetical protein